MSEDELLATIPGNMLYGLSERDGKTKWAQAYGKQRRGKGKINGVFGSDKYTAEYFVQGGQWCENWGSGSGCWHVERIGDKEFRMYKDGKPGRQNWFMK